MAGDRCVACGNGCFKDKSVTLHRFPRNPTTRKAWASALELREQDIKAHSRVCSRHFLNSDLTVTPTPRLGKRFASPKKLWTARARRSRERDSRKELGKLTVRLKSPPTKNTQSGASCTSSRASSIVSSTGDGENECCDDPEVLTAVVDDCVTASTTESPMTEESSEQATDTDIDSIVCGQSPLSNSFFSNTSTSFSSNFTSVSQTLTDPSVVVSSALLAKIETLEAENKCLKKKLSTKQQPFRIEDIAHDDKKIHFYTGFRSYEILVTFFEFLGPAVDQLQYWVLSSASLVNESKVQSFPH